MQTTAISKDLDFLPTRCRATLNFCGFQSLRRRGLAFPSSRGVTHPCAKQTVPTIGDNSFPNDEDGGHLPSSGAPKRRWRPPTEC